MSDRLVHRMRQIAGAGALADLRSAQRGTGGERAVRSPIDGALLAACGFAAADDAPLAVDRAAGAFPVWRDMPAPRRGEFVRRFGNALRDRKADLAEIVTLECGKITPEALGEVQEMIDICDFAVGLSRGLYGRTIASERPGHRLMEQWHPLGPVGVITAFNFPVAVWAWNAAIAWVCGDPVVWKPSEKTPLCAMACQSIASDVAREMGDVPAGVSCLIVGGADVGEALAADPRLPLISATGSVPMGRAVAQTVARRLGRSLLELGGNNAAIVTPSADLDLALPAVVFSAAGTCGQRCTTLRRLIVHDQLYDVVHERLLAIYRSLRIGDPREQGVLVGPLIDEDACLAMHRTLATAKQQGGAIHGGNRIADDVPAGGAYVRPAIVEIAPDAPILRHETFAPILYLMRYRTLEDALAIHNDVPQGLASSIFTADLREAERFCSAAGSDCGIVNVNVGPSGAEIGGAFGGEKDTGGGREAGSDSWKAYMRRTTHTINYSRDLPLAQGVDFKPIG